MNPRTGLTLIAVTGLMLTVAVHVTGQAPQQGASPPAAAADAPSQEHGGPPPAGAQPQRQRRNLPRFPAHQRPPADPAVVERGRGLYAGSCGACHGVDARGGQLGGPNLLRSQLVLNDQNGELIIPVVQNGRPGTLMPPMPMSEEDITAIAMFLHSLQAAGTNQGGPPPGPEVELDILVGDPAAGARYFQGTCSSCHSATGDLQGIATRVSEAKQLQNLWVSGGRGGRRGGAASAPPVTATITLASGEQVQGRLLHLDDFLVTVAQPDGTSRSIHRAGDQPRVEIHDPLEQHRTLLSVYTDKNMHDVTAYLATLK